MHGELRLGRVAGSDLDSINGIWALQERYSPHLDQSVHIYVDPASSQLHIEHDIIPPVGHVWGVNGGPCLPIVVAHVAGYEAERNFECGAFEHLEHTVL